MQKYLSHLQHLQKGQIIKFPRLMIYNFMCSVLSCSVHVAA